MPDTDGVATTVEAARAATSLAARKSRLTTPWPVSARDSGDFSELAAAPGPARPRRRREKRARRDGVPARRAIPDDGPRLQARPAIASRTIQMPLRSWTWVWIRSSSPW